MPKASPTLVPPRQARSRKTLERILTATEHLLRGRLFEEISIHDIVARAKTSVGAFYTRFPNKDALLPSLYERYDARLHAEVEELVSDRSWDELELEARVQRLVRLIVETYRQRRGLMRAIGLHARRHPETITAEVRERRNALHARISGVLLERRAEIGHPDPESAVPMALFIVGATAREKILFSGAPHASSLAVEDESLSAELVRTVLAYLDVTHSRPKPRRRRSAGAPLPKKRSRP